MRGLVEVGSSLALIVGGIMRRLIHTVATSHSQESDETSKTHGGIIMKCYNSTRHQETSLMLITLHE